MKSLPTIPFTVEEDKRTTWTQQWIIITIGKITDGGVDTKARYGGQDITSDGEYDDHFKKNTKIFGKSARFFDFKGNKDL